MLAEREREVFGWARVGELAQPRGQAAIGVLGDLRRQGPAPRPQLREGDPAVGLRALRPTRRVDARVLLLGRERLPSLGERAVGVPLLLLEGPEASEELRARTIGISLAVISRIILLFAKYAKERFCQPHDPTDGKQQDDTRDDG